MSESAVLVPVRASEHEALKEYVHDLYDHVEQHDAKVHIHDGVDSLLRNGALATSYFIRRGQERLGYVILTRYHTVKKGGLTIFVDELFVEPRFRRQGIGKQVMTAIVKIAQEQKAKALWAVTEPFNQGAQAFFLGEGFSKDPQANFQRPL